MCSLRFLRRAWRCRQPRHSRCSGRAGSKSARPCRAAACRAEVMSSAASVAREQYANMQPLPPLSVLEGPPPSGPGSGRLKLVRARVPPPPLLSAATAKCHLDALLIMLLRTLTCGRPAAPATSRVAPPARLHSGWQSHRLAARPPPPLWQCLRPTRAAYRCGWQASRRQTSASTQWTTSACAPSFDIPTTVAGPGRDGLVAARDCVEVSPALSYLCSSKYRTCGNAQYTKL